MDRKKSSPIARHSARVIIMSMSMLLFCAFISILLGLISQYIIKLPSSMTGNPGFTTALFVATVMMWQLNIRFGWVENILEEKKKYPQLSAWFESVSGR